MQFHECEQLNLDKEVASVRVVIVNLLTGVEGKRSGLDGLTDMVDRELASAKGLMDEHKPNFVVHTAASVLAKRTIDSSNGSSSMERWLVAPRPWLKKLLNLFKEAGVYMSQRRSAFLPLNILAATAASGHSIPTGSDVDPPHFGDLTSPHGGTPGIHFSSIMCLDDFSTFTSHALCALVTSYSKPPDCNHMSWSLPVWLLSTEWLTDLAGFGTKVNNINWPNAEFLSAKLHAEVAIFWNVKSKSKSEPGILSDFPGAVIKEAELLMSELLGNNQNLGTQFTLLHS